MWHGTERLYVNRGHSGREERAGEGQVNGWGRVCTGREERAGEGQVNGWGRVCTGRC